MSPIRTCQTQALPFDTRQACLLKIFYGPGMDCPAGCIYERLFAVMLPDGTFHEVSERPFFELEERVVNAVWEAIEFPLETRHVNEIGQSRLIRNAGRYAVQYAFTEYLEGSVTVAEDGTVAADLEPRPECLSFEEEAPYLYAIEIVKSCCTDAIYTAKVCENGTVQIMKDDAVVHRRNILDGRK